MNLEQLPLSRQIDFVFAKMKGELCHVSSGTVFIHIRNNVVGKFGIKHLPIESKGGVLAASPKQGLTAQQYESFRQMAIDSLKYKQHWTHGEIMLDFTIRLDVLVASVQFESNYNMASYNNGKAL